MKNIWILFLVAISFTGCYTSFSPRDAESDMYGKLNEGYYDSPEVASAYDSLDVEDYGSVEEFPQNDVVVVNNYYNDLYGYTPSLFGTVAFGGYGVYNSFYDPFYSYYPPFYSVYYPNYAGSYINVYGDAYFGWGYPDYYYGGGYFSPSPIRYRNDMASSYLAGSSLRNTRGRTTLSRRSRDVSTRSSRRDVYTSTNSSNVKGVRGFDLDRDLIVTKRANGTSTSSNLRNAGIIKTNNARTASKRTTDLSRRRITSEKKYRILASRSSSRASRIAKRTYGRMPKQSVKNKKVNKSRSKRTYSSSGSSSSRSSSSRSYYRPPSRSSSRSSNVSGSSRGSSHYGSSRSTTRSSSRSSSSSSSKRTRRR